MIRGLPVVAGKGIPHVGRICACRTGGRACLGPAGRRQCLHHEPRANRATVAAVLGLIGAVIGGLALARPAGRFGTSSGRLGAVVALAGGVIAIALGGLVAVTSDSGIGTGNGRGGSYVALLVGLIALVLGGLALARSRHTAAPADRRHTRA